MRKPSWNKSQAIQQVISLKALFETTPESDTGQRKKRHIPRPDTSLQRVRFDLFTCISSFDYLHGSVMNMMLYLLFKFHSVSVTLHV